MSAKSRPLSVIRSRVAVKFKKLRNSYFSFPEMFRSKSTAIRLGLWITGYSNLGKGTDSFFLTVVLFHFQKCFDRSRPRDDRQEGDRGSDLARSPQPEVPDRGCQDQSLGQGGWTQNAQELQDHGIGRSHETDVS